MRRCPPPIASYVPNATTRSRSLYLGATLAADLSSRSSISSCSKSSFCAAPPAPSRHVSLSMTKKPRGPLLRATIAQQGQRTFPRHCAANALDPHKL